MVRGFGVGARRIKRAEVTGAPNLGWIRTGAVSASASHHAGQSAVRGTAAGAAAGRTPSIPGMPSQPLSQAARQQSLHMRQATAASGGRVAWRRRMDSHNQLVWVREATEEEHEEGETVSGPLAQQYVRALGSNGGLDWVHVSQARGLAAGFDLASVAALPFSAKLEWFRSQVSRARIPWEQGHVQVCVARSSVLGDSVRQFARLRSTDLRKTFRFKFRGEPGIDAGGVAREWFTVVTKAVFNADTGLFSYSHVDNLSYQINPHSGALQPDHEALFYFVGRFLGKALFDQQLVPAHLVRPLFKHLLGMPMSFADLEFVDGDLYQNLRWMVENEGAEALMLDFTVSQMVLGEMQTAELKPGGASIEVTDDNKHEYIDLRMRRPLFESIKVQLEALLRGFYEVIPLALISPFDFQELELLLCGLPEVDVADWRAHTMYRNCSAGQELIKWFWRVVEGLSHEDRARLLQFVTGTSRVPVQGFSALQGNDGQVKHFCIHAVPYSYEYPRAHTCFNRLDLPRYRTAEELKRYLRLVLQMELTGFGMQ